MGRCGTTPPVAKQLRAPLSYENFQIATAVLRVYEVRLLRNLGGGAKHRSVIVCPMLCNVAMNNH
ncbi:MAG: hypothetical protein J7J01_00870, partial [Methanophagales archaeon]|nr:hypothetical protein [Methanophagales archaeon]